MKKIFFTIVLILFAFLANRTTAQNNAELNKLIEEAVRVSPKIQMLGAKQKVAGAVVPQVSNLPDPAITLGLNNLPVNSFSFTQEPMTGKVLGLSQAFPYPGKLSAAGKVREQDIDIVQQEIDDYKNQIARDVTK